MVIICDIWDENFNYLEQHVIFVEQTPKNTPFLIICSRFFEFLMKSWSNTKGFITGGFKMGSKWQRGWTPLKSWGDNTPLFRPKALAAKFTF